MNVGEDKMANNSGLQIINNNNNKDFILRG